MHEHNWIIEVCQDLKNYAEQHGLENLASMMNEAVSVARLDAILLANKDACVGVFEADTCLAEPSNVVPMRATS